MPAASCPRQKQFLYYFPSKLQHYHSSIYLTAHWNTPLFSRCFALSLDGCIHSCFLFVCLFVLWVFFFFWSLPQCFVQNRCSVNVCKWVAGLEKTKGHNKGRKNKFPGEVGFVRQLLKEWDNIHPSRVGVTTWSPRGPFSQPMCLLSQHAWCYKIFRSEGLWLVHVSPLSCSSHHFLSSPCISDICLAPKAIRVCLLLYSSLFMTAFLLEARSSWPKHMEDEGKCVVPLVSLPFSSR